MYNVSNAYKTAMHNRVQKFKVRGTVGNVSFSDENILAGSLSISNQCSGSDNIDIGQVYIGELNCTFLGLPIDRNSWFGKEIIIDFGQCLDDGSYEFIPLGVFTVAEADYTESGVAVKAYDHVAKLDKTCSSLSTGAKPYNLAKIACDACRVALETSEAEFLRFPNGKVTLGIYAENDIKTYRDALSWIAQTCAVSLPLRGRAGFFSDSTEANPLMLSMMLTDSRAVLSPTSPLGTRACLSSTSESRPPAITLSRLMTG